MFSVYGKSRILAKKTASKLMDNKHSDISKELKNFENYNQEVKQRIIDDYIDEIFKGMKPKRCTHEFSTPKIMEEAFSIMAKDKYNFSELQKMKKQVKINKSGGDARSKTAGKLILEWVTYK